MRIPKYRLNLHMLKATYWIETPYYNGARFVYRRGYSKPGINATITTNVNPWYRIKYKTIYRVEMLFLWLRSEMYKQCQGCGEGISRWKILDPNYNLTKSKKKYLNCCNKCVSFYDWSFSRKYIKQWRGGKAYLTKKIYK